jgi:HAD superfamily hydrolase (TIGR01549 family)
MPLTAIFFDAGNTLIFPDLARTLAPLHSAGLAATRDQLHAAERASKQRRDREAASGRSTLVDQDYWMIYYSALLASIGHPDAELQSSLVREARRSQNWECVLPGTRESLLELKQRYRLGIISNSDGHIAELIQRLGLADCFEAVIDSGMVGHEKPDVRIFQAAMTAVRVAPADSMYVGDIYSIDYLGAAAAGMQPMLFDVCGAYRDTDLQRVESLKELAERLLRAS